jgi:hypothetical protein
VEPNPPRAVDARPLWKASIAFGLGFGVPLL